MTNTETSWRTEHSIETPASPEAIWRIVADVPGWTSWNAGIESVDLSGAFATGARFTMKPPGQDAFESTLLDVREEERFVDETRVGDLVVTVDHRIEQLGARRTRITYAIEARGPEAATIGPMIAADFPEVLASLAAKAERA
jgi:hypothetical protein